MFDSLFGKKNNMMLELADLIATNSADTVPMKKKKAPSKGPRLQKPGPKWLKKKTRRKMAQLSRRLNAGRNGHTQIRGVK